MDREKSDVLLSRFAQKIHGQMTLGISQENLFDFIFDSLSLVIPFDRIGIATLSGGEGEERLVSTWVKSKVPVQHLKVRYSSPLRGGSLQKIIEEGKPRIIGDLEQYLKDHPNSESTKLILKDGIRSSLTCLLRANNRPIGFVFFSSAKPHQYRPEHAQVFLDVANELSLIVEQNHLRDISIAVSSREQNFRMALHDLKSPLAVIQGYIDLAKSEDWFQSLNEEAKGIFATLNRNAVHMATLLGELSDLAQLESNISSCERQPFDLSELIFDLIEDGRAMTAKKEISFAIELGENLPSKLKCDPVSIRRAVDNLFSNATKYSQRKTTVKFSVFKPGDGVDFVVADEGQGIAECELPKLFKEFTRASSRPTEGEPSSGLGLAIVRKIALQHGGTVAVESRVGEGSKFTLSIPWE